MKLDGCQFCETGGECLTDKVGTQEFTDLEEAKLACKDMCGCMGLYSEDGGSFQLRGDNSGAPDPGGCAFPSECNADAGGTTYKMSCELASRASDQPAEKFEDWEAAQKKKKKAQRGAKEKEFVMEQAP